MKGLVFLVLLLGALAGASTLTYTYDDAGRLVALNYGGATNTTLSYDNNGNVLSQSTFVSANPDLSLTQSATPALAVVGLPVQYAVEVFNSSTGSSTGVVLTNSLPVNGSFLSSSASQGGVLHSGGLLTWNIGTLAGGSTASLTFSVLANEVGTLTNVASIGAAQTDPNPANNTSTLLTPVGGLPSLLTAASGSSFIVSWPIASGGSFTLEHTDSLTPPVRWVPEPVSPAISDNAFYIVEPTTTNLTRFYRLVAGP